MEIIKLNRGYEALVDDEDFERVNQFRWFITINGYASRTINFKSGPQETKTQKMHRFILNVPDDMETDHINHNRLDNRKCNLRICTKSENQHNAKVRKDSISGYKGVSQRNNSIYRKKPWRAYITYKGKPKHIGYYRTALEAAIAYNMMAKEYFGEFAYLNKVL
jgi:hypothetical protein